MLAVGRTIVYYFRGHGMFAPPPLVSFYTAHRKSTLIPVWSCRSSVLVIGLMWTRYLSIWVKYTRRQSRLFVWERSRQLDAAARSVFQENVRLNRALKYHVKESEELLRATDALEKQNASLALDKVCLSCTANNCATNRPRPWTAATHLHKFIFNRCSYETLVRSVQNIFQVVFSFVLFTRADPVYFACGSSPPPPPPDYYPASQWSVVVVSFHWCMCADSAASPSQVTGVDSPRPINNGRINLTLNQGSKYTWFALATCWRTTCSRTSSSRLLCSCRSTRPGHV